MKNLTNADKYQATRRAIVNLLQACGPCDMADIIAEVRVQAYASHLPKALSDLMLSLTITYNAEEQAYEMR